MACWMQWVIAIAMVLAFYFGYVHGAIRECQVEKVQVGMTEKQVRRLLGRPRKQIKRGSNVVYRYKFWYINRLAPETRVSVHVEFCKGKVTSVHHTRQ